MTSYKKWCKPSQLTDIESHVIDVLTSTTDEVGIAFISAYLPSRYAETKSLTRIAERFGKGQVAKFLQNKLPTAQSARSGDLGEILAAAFLEEDCGYVVGPSRLIQRDHQEWAMRGDDVLGARLDSSSKVHLIKGEAKSRAQARSATVAEAREGLQRSGGLPSPHSLTQFAERLLGTVDDNVGEIILTLQLEDGIRPKTVTHLMFLFTGNNPTSHVKADLAAYEGDIAQRAVILRVQAHQDFVRAVYEKAIAERA
ncbi:SAVED domain-containing protein [Streptomyces sp. P9-2B-2]|uniref:Hachiman antiphage defense system protein HamA n=1 Tax=Streptomyces sp. P9-2B-2 TaxID=3057114 RepID=UPI0025B61CE7|nr:Hachiman antiphage defense system protein HamA [Streptomyces sp. P9-2B-2]WJY40048.1 SAVED domain-containing protein [Streptomyces sp. P9-2B-2]